MVKFLHKIIMAINPNWELRLIEWYFEQLMRKYPAYKQVDNQSVHNGMSMDFGGVSLVSLRRKAGNIKAFMVSFSERPDLEMDVTYRWKVDCFSYNDTYTKQPLGSYFLGITARGPHEEQYPN